MRSFLTVLGVIIGTGTIIGVGSIIAGLDGAITGVHPQLRNQHRDHFQISDRLSQRAAGDDAAAQAAHL